MWITETQELACAAARNVPVTSETHNHTKYAHVWFRSGIPGQIALPHTKRSRQLQQHTLDLLEARQLVAEVASRSQTAVVQTHVYGYRRGRHAPSEQRVLREHFRAPE